jgi:glutathione S-transferase
MMQLYGAPESPWTERARWPLDHHRLSYEHFSGTRLQDMAKLRLLTRRPTGALPLPILRDNLQVISGSFEIALHAERAGTGPRLVPDITAAIRWNRLGERALAASRLLAEQRIAEDPAALQELLPEAVPAGVRELLTPLAEQWVRMHSGPREASPPVSDLAESSLRDLLGQVRATLVQSPYLLGTSFSLADISIAVAIDSFAPRAAGGPALGPATRDCWTHRALSAEFADLLEWRNLIYAKHRS